MRARSPLRRASAALLAALAPAVAAAQVAVPPPDLRPLNQLAVPEPPNLFQFVKSKPAAIRLGKALFWDMQVGSDGVQACASCHFHAGADSRTRNTVNPGTPAGDTTFQVRGPNQTLQPSDFPFHQRADPDFQDSPVVRDSNDVVGSQGVTLTDFVAIVPGQAEEIGTPVPDPVFTAGGHNVRRVTGRNTPSVINAVFNFANFWDGRAHFQFNGVNPFGPLDPSAGIWVIQGGVLVKRPVAIPFASLASQAVGPPLDGTEMSFRGRTFPMLGRKLLSLVPLGKQLVHPNDGVLGPLSRASLQGGNTIGQNGLSVSYAQLIQDAFHDDYWQSPLTTPEGHSQMEANFSLFWGLAIQLYEATLVSDQTRYDRFLGGDASALTTQEQDGFNLFFGSAGCSGCHSGTEGTNATVSAALFLSNSSNVLIEQMPTASGRSVIYDQGFNNTGVRPTTEDLGRGADSPFTNPMTGQPFPLGLSSLAQLQALGLLGFDGSLFPAGTPLTPILPAQIPSSFPVGNRGAFKMPGLRNVELTAPYFHNGGDGTLEDVMDFYVRGGNFPNVNADDLDALIADIGTLQNKPERHAMIIAFMNAMTDERVRNRSAPFDHPELFVPNGHAADGSTEFLHLPARDQNGNAASTIAVTLDPPASPTRVASQTLRGTFGAGATVTVSVNGGAPFAATTSGGNWSAQVSGLAEGTNAVTVRGTDLSGTTTLSASIVVDTTPPALALGTFPAATSSTEVTLGGTVEAGITPTVTVFSTALPDPVAVSGNAWSVRLGGLVPGVNTFVVTATDAAGNQTARTATVIQRLADGDLDGSGAVDQADALRALRISAGIVPAGPADLQRGDAAPLQAGVPTQNGAVDIRDAQLILRKASGLVTF